MTVLTQLLAGKFLKINNYSFKDLTDGKYRKNDLEIPFTLFISDFRRKQLLNSMMSKDKSERKRGEKIMN